MRMWKIHIVSYIEYKKCKTVKAINKGTQEIPPDIENILLRFHIRRSEICVKIGFRVFVEFQIEVSSKHTRPLPIFLLSSSQHPFTYTLFLSLIYAPNKHICFNILSVCKAWANLPSLFSYPNKYFLVELSRN